MARLDPIVDLRAPLVGRVRKRLALAAGFLLGGATVAALVVASGAGREPGTAIVFAPPPPAPLPPPPPIVVTLQTPAPTPVLDPITRACPTIAREDLPIGAPVELAAGYYSDDATDEQVVAAGDASQLAIRVGPRVWISDDDGRSFRPSLADREVTSIAVDRGGVLYAASGSELGVRAPRGKVTWRAQTNIACSGDCSKVHLAMLGSEVAWSTDADVTVSADRGRTWKTVDTSEYAWGDSGRLVSWRGALYKINRYTDMCGVDDTYVHRLDAKHRVAHAIFPNNYMVAGPVLAADNPTSTTWSWRVRCWRDPSTNQIGACSDTAAMRAELLTAGTVVPVEGGRTLAVWSGSLVELCGDGARQIAPHFPMEHVDAVDAVGRPLVLRHGVLYRWSPVHGWRRLFVAPDAS